MRTQSVARSRVGRLAGLIAVIALPLAAGIAAEGAARSVMGQGDLPLVYLPWWYYVLAASVALLLLAQPLVFGCRPSVIDTIASVGIGIGFLMLVSSAEVLVPMDVFFVLAFIVGPTVVSIVCLIGMVWLARAFRNERRLLVGLAVAAVSLLVLVLAELYVEGLETRLVAGRLTGFLGEDLRSVSLNDLSSSRALPFAVLMYASATACGLSLSRSLRRRLTGATAVQQAHPADFGKR